VVMNSLVGVGVVLLFLVFIGWLICSMWLCIVMLNWLLLWCSICMFCWFWVCFWGVVELCEFLFVMF